MPSRMTEEVDTDLLNETEVADMKPGKKSKSKKDKEKKRKRKAENNDDVEEASLVPSPKKKKKKKDKIETEDLVLTPPESPCPDDSSNQKKKKKKKKAKKEASNGNVDSSESKTIEDVTITPEEREGAFSNFRISKSTVEKLQALGVKYLFPVQAKTFDYVYDGQDVIAQARTGTGKTFAFATPLVEQLQKTASKGRGRPPKALIMSPTRELAIQITKNINAISEGLAVQCVYGGTPYWTQETAIRNGLDIVVGTPGRVKDFVEKGTLDLSKLEHMVLDEVDRMLDMGFADTVDNILKTAYNQEGREKNPQTLLFSATMPAWVHVTGKKYMNPDVKKVDLIGTDRVKAARTVQHLAIKCGYHDRAATIGDVMQVYSGNHGRAMVFCETKRDADELAISTSIKQESHVMHGDIPQDKREKVLQGFRDGRYKCLITTDVAARGLDIPEVDLVIQCCPPKDVDSYIHRSGRTGRAGREGVCVMFYKHREEYELQQVERKAGITFKRVGAPTPQEIIKASADDAVRALDEIPESTLSHFQESAEKLISEQGAVKALSAALAVISGSTEIAARSLIDSQQGFTTYLFRTNMEMERLGYAWRALERHIPEEVKEKISKMKFCKDKMGCVFDLPSEFDTVVDDRWQDSKFNTLAKATELPELLETDSINSYSSGGNFGRGGSFRGRGRWGNGSGYGGRGRGGGRGFRGSGGGRGGGRGFGGNRGFGGGSNSKKTFD